MVGLTAEIEKLHLQIQEGERNRERLEAERAELQRLTEKYA